MEYVDNTDECLLTYDEEYFIDRTITDCCLVIDQLGIMEFTKKLHSQYSQYLKDKEGVDYGQKELKL